MRLQFSMVRFSESNPRGESWQLEVEQGFSVLKEENCVGGEFSNIYPKS